MKGSDFNQEQVQAESQAGGPQLAPIAPAATAPTAVAATAAAAELQPDCEWTRGETHQLIDEMVLTLNAFPSSCCSSIFPSDMEDHGAAPQ